ncbi:MAG: Na(+)/H(+) antiporter subunit D [Bacteroidetes bacterium]|nr:Na(+)/H(+) antiporter subunit D [Bacteroidota bacterium]MBU1422027.1 Na(+)/H(+) antiporter subunit D [Bacteroidota bacterium]MBU2471038.1 Na(+)/H(+) antiporter subunit D [Bacteroidota bacterium]MBU2636455.1 Na(+)/H(+) antiporter subunit D [Bacteroidota bacterium]
MISLGFIPPAFIQIIAAIILPIVPKKLRSTWFLVSSLSTLIYLWLLPEGTSPQIEFIGYNIVLLKVDALSKIFAAFFAIITFIAGVYSFHLKDTSQQVAALLYGASSIGVTFAGDFITLFIYWELMAVSSLLLIWAQKDNQSHKAGMRYLIVHLFGGSLLLTGIILHISDTGSILVEQLFSRSSVANWFLIAGIGLNAAIPPLHAWLPDSYSRATVTGSVFLSALTTKTAVYALARIFPGWEVLLILGTAMTLYGVIYAVLSNDLRELLAYHIISQVGYMVAGIGIGTELAINGSTAHAFSNILYKSLLFMGVGAVIYSTGKSKMSELGGLSKQMPITLVLYLIGAFSISGFPLLNGFISKSMIVYAAGEIHNYTAVLLMNLAMVGTFLSTTLKLPYFTWYYKNEPPKDLEINPIPFNMHLGMGIAGFLCIFFGIAPEFLYKYLPYAVNYEPYTGSHLVETAEILIFTFFAFWIFKSKLAADPMISLDLDWIYRRPKNFVKRLFIDGVLDVFDLTDIFLKGVVKTLVDFGKNPTRSVTYLISPVAVKANPEFDPNTARPTMLFVISGVLLIFVVVVALAIL